MTVFLGYLTAAMTVTATVFATGIVYFALQNHSQRAQIDSLTQDKARRDKEYAAMRDLLIAELMRPVASENGGES